MEYMFLTLDVSMLSGWLNARAYCPVTPRHVEGDLGGWVVRGRVAAVAVHAACTEEPAGHWSRHARGGAHPKHARHANDAGRVEA